MWKYQCKRHLGILLIAFLAGAVLMGAMGYQQDLVIETVKQWSFDTTLLSSPYIYYIVGGISLAGIMNGMMLSLYVIQKFNIPYIFALFILVLLSSIVAGIGVIALLPSVVVAIFGWITIPNRGKHKALTKNSITNVVEVERVYRLHHTYVEDTDALAKKAWFSILRINIIYIVGILGIILVFLYVKQFMIMLAAMILYSMLFIQLAKLKNQAIQPIIALLYEDCNPQACASAIFALAKKARKKKTFPMPQHLAQCMIYLNDPHLAIDILATCNQSKGNFIFAYHSLMAYAYYQLGDESMVKYHYEQCDKATIRINNGPMLIIKKQCLDGIQNKLDLMQKNFGSARKFYQTALTNVGFEFQRVDFKYYLGLIAFVNRDLDDAQDAFEYVRTHGGSIYYVEKAKSFLEIINKANAEA